MSYLQACNDKRQSLTKLFIASFASLCAVSGVHWLLSAERVAKKEPSRMKKKKKCRTAPPQLHPKCLISTHATNVSSFNLPSHPGRKA